jgi:type IV pilus assembly protein PilM
MGMPLSKLGFSNLQDNFIDKIFPSAPFIGLDLGMEKLNMVQVDFKSGEPVIIAASSDYHNSSYQELVLQPELFKALIKNTIKLAGFKGRKVVATVPTPLLKIIFLNFQCKADEIEDQALLNALKQRIDGNLSDYVIDYLPINPQMNEQINRVALVAMAKNDAIDGFLELLNYCGLAVEALEIGPVAIKRLVSALTRSEQTQKVLTINFGAQKSYLTVIWNNELLLDREIDFGIDNVINAIAKAFDINNKTALKVLHEYGLATEESTELLFEDDLDEEDDSRMTSVLLDVLRPSFFQLSEEIKDVLVYVASETRGGAVELIYLMGSLSRISAVDKVIDGLISIPVQTINPFFGFSAEEKPTLLNDLGPLSGVAVATGLSMRGKI